MPTLYCDHNVLIKVQHDEGVPPTGRFGRVLETGQVQIVFSTTHLIEAARMRSIQEVTAMARLLDLAGTRWLPDRISLELDEIRHTLAGGPAPEPLVRTVTEVAAKLNRPQVAPEIVTALRLVQGWNARPQLLGPMLDSHQRNIRAFKANVRDTKKGKLKHVPDAALLRLVVRRLAEIHQVRIDEQ